MTAEASYLNCGNTQQSMSTPTAGKQMMMIQILNHYIHVKGQHAIKSPESGRKAVAFL